MFLMVLVLQCNAFVVIVLFDEQGRKKGQGLVNRKLVKAPTPVILLLAVQRRLFYFDSLVVIDVVCGYLLFFVFRFRYEQ